MQLFKRVNHIIPYITYLKSMGFSIGFAPTMGALHQGHLSLVDHANKHSDISVAASVSTSAIIASYQDFQGSWFVIILV